MAEPSKEQQQQQLSPVLGSGESKPRCDGSEREAGFLCGVVEGFYGRPWTTEQRKDLFRKMKQWGMDSYIYAPKDDYKHRAYWRELYTVEEADHLTGLISAAHEQNINFYYALSPGLDITYSSSKELATLKRKLDQVSQFGCKAFALLFDDIEPEMSKPDKEVFQSFAYAQVSVTNEVYNHLNCPRFLFCPTQYCSSRAVPTVKQSEYLNTLGSKLIGNIDILWTGEKVISKLLTVECIQEITEVLKRPPVIWDNLHANDYDQKRVFLGPYSGRSPEIIPLLRGVVTNPNCEFHANSIAIQTLAFWSKCSSDTKISSSVSSDIKLETENEDGICQEDAPAFLRSFRVTRKIARCPNKELCYDLFSYVWDIAAVLSMLSAYVKWLAMGNFPANINSYTQGGYTWFSKGWKETFTSGDQEPWVFRGGLVADLQRLIPLDVGNDLFLYKLPETSAVNLYTMRPYVYTDEAILLDVCNRTANDGEPVNLGSDTLKNVLADRYLGPFLTIAPQLCIVAENNRSEVVGYACAAMDTKTFLRNIEQCWAPEMCLKYPLSILENGVPPQEPPSSPTGTTAQANQLARDCILYFHNFKNDYPVAVLNTHPSILSTRILKPHLLEDDALGKRLVTVLLAMLRSNGSSSGVHVCIEQTDQFMYQFYSKLGFVELYREDGGDSVVYLGRNF
ncbi:hypothetical protein pipiens_008447 [Culex pipiens pipiens]|uniref:protein O-GlcNAcase n=1 Tax=Culex pipiens pipiens TaxID=38569 RepID=A0ABD1DHV9_CULPP